MLGQSWRTRSRVDMHTALRTISVTIAVLMAWSDLAHAQLRAPPVDTIIPGLHNTGVDDDNKKLKDGDLDPHFTVTGPVSGTPRVVGASKIPKDWVSRQDSSLWISIAADAIAPEGTYTYTMKFDLTGFEPSSVSIAGLW